MHQISYFWTRYTILVIAPILWAAQWLSDRLPTPVAVSICIAPIFIAYAALPAIAFHILAGAILSALATFMVIAVHAAVKEQGGH